MRRERIGDRTQPKYQGGVLHTYGIPAQKYQDPRSGPEVGKVHSHVGAVVVEEFNLITIHILGCLILTHSSRPLTSDPTEELRRSPRSGPITRT